MKWQQAPLYRFHKEQLATETWLVYNISCSYSCSIVLRSTAIACDKPQVNALHEEQKPQSGLLRLCTVALQAEVPKTFS
jgi:hypothetical protein